MRAAFLFMVAAAPLFAQLDNDTITITASRAVSAVGPDEVRLLVTVTADPGKSLEEVLSALEGLGLTERDLMGVGPIGTCTSTLGCPDIPLEWWFETTNPIGDLKQMLAKMSGLDLTGRSGLSVAYSITSDASAAPDCPLAALISQARQQAQSVAAAAGLGAGSVVALSDGKAVVVQTAIAGADDFGQSPPGTASVLLTSPSPAVASACTTVVQFKLLR